MDIHTVLKLNEVVGEAYSGRVARSDRPVFYCGKWQDKIKSVINNVAPFGKIVLLYNNASFSELGVAATEIMKSVCCKPYNVIVAGKDGVKNVSELLSSPEDVRLIIVFDRSLIATASYFANLRGVPLLYVMRGIEAEGVLSPRIVIDNGGKPDFLKVNVKRHILIDVNTDSCTDKEMASAYMYIMSSLIAFSDYRINCAVKGEKTDKAAYSLARNAVLSTYGIYSYKREDLPTVLIYNGLLTEIADLVSMGKLFGACALKNAERLLVGADRVDTGTRAGLFYSLMGIYALAFSDKYDMLPDVPDYNARAEYLAEKINGGLTFFAVGLKKQIAAVRKNTDGVDAVKSKLKEEILSQNVSVNKIRSVLQTFGVDTAACGTEGKLALKHCGDFGEQINGMTLAREKGLAELI